MTVHSKKHGEEEQGRRPGWGGGLCFFSLGRAKISGRASPESIFSLTVEPG
jgi:hypothetical protein